MYNINICGRCPYTCANKTSDGYCKTTACIRAMVEGTPIRSETYILRYTDRGTAILIRQKEKE